MTGIEKLKQGVFARMDEILAEIKEVENMAGEDEESLKRLTLIKIEISRLRELTENLTPRTLSKFPEIVSSLREAMKYKGRE